jgi:hypothetical protein
VNICIMILCVMMPCNQMGDVAVMLCTSICEVVGLNLGQYASSPDFFLLFLSTTMHELSDRRLLVKLVPTFADRRCRMVSATDPHRCILRFLDWSRYFFFQVAPQLYSRG